MQRLALFLLAGCAPTFALVVPSDTSEPEPDPEVPNVAPIADAGTDQRVPVGTPLVLDGGSSYDPDSNELFYTWEILTAPRRSRATARSQGETAAFDPDVVGLFEVRLTVQDADGAIDEDIVTVESVDTWGDNGGRPAPGDVYLLGAIDGGCRRGVTALRRGSPAYVGFDCSPEPESVMVQVDGAFWWVGGSAPREQVCDSPCWVTRPNQFPGGDLAANDMPLDVPCPEEAVEVVLGPDRTLARCFSDGRTWVDERGPVLSDTSWQPFAVGQDRLVLVRRKGGRDIAVVDPRDGSIHPTDPPLDWQFLRSWRAFEDGFRVAAFDNRDRTTLVEVDASGAVTPVGIYADLPDGTVVRVGSRLDSAGNLYLPVVINGVSQVLRADLDGDVDPVWDDARDLLVRVGGGGELVTGP